MTYRCDVVNGRNIEKYLFYYITNEKNIYIGSVIRKFWSMYVFSAFKQEAENIQANSTILVLKIEKKEMLFLKTWMILSYWFFLIINGFKGLENRYQLRIKISSRDVKQIN